MKLRPLVLAALICVAAFVSGPVTSAAMRLASSPETARLARAHSSFVSGVVVSVAKGLMCALVGGAKS